MSIRVTLCILLVIVFSFYAYRNWFASACAAVVLMAAIEHPDMPKSIGGIQGLNPWNFLIFNTVVAWLKNRNRDGYSGWNAPFAITVTFLLYVLIIIVSFFRLIADPQNLREFSYGSAISEWLINTLKWILPGLLMYDACRTRTRVIAALSCVLFIYFALAIQTINYLPISAAAADGAQLARLSSKLCVKEIGYHRVNLSMLFAGASWAVLAMLVLVSDRRLQILLLCGAGSIALGQAVTGGRAGYVTWLLIGVVLGVLRWRRILGLIPLVVLCVCILLPGVRERMLQGFGGRAGSIVVGTSDYTVTAGRTLAWKEVIREIKKAPMFGYGRQAMIRTGIYDWMFDMYGESDAFPHPHNAYLELLLDNGIFGFLCVIPFYVLVVLFAFRLFRDRSDPLFGAVGGVCCALVLALLFAAMGSQSFYPREGSVGMWVAIGLMLRVSLERARSLASGLPLFGGEEEESNPAFSASLAGAQLAPQH